MGLPGITEIFAILWVFPCYYTEIVSVRFIYIIKKLVMVMIYFLSSCYYIAGGRLVWSRQMYIQTGYSVIIITAIVSRVKNNPLRLIKFSQKE